MKTPLKLLFALVLLSSSLVAQRSQNLVDSKTRDLLHEALSGELAKEHVIQISRHHRIQGSRGYRDAAQYVLSQLRSYGYSEKDAYVESFKSDGKVTYQTWQSPSGWDISWAELRMIEPYDERIVGYPEIAMSVMTYSNAGDATGELVWVGSGTSDNDYKGKDVAGKIVLATGYGGAVHRLAVLKYGAKAAVCFLDDERAKEYPDMLQYTGMWPKTHELEKVTFGFNLTNRQGIKLRDMLLAGKKVVVRGQVKGIGLEPYFMDVVVAHIRGSERPDEELVYSAHLDHPKESANDNASGSAALVDIARGLKELIDGGRLPRPKRSIRFIWIPEWNGTMPYIDAHPEIVGPELGGKFLANINMDMVGENQELLHSRMIMTRTPFSLPSVLNDVIENMADMVAEMDIRTPRGSLSTFNYRVIPYSGGSDHMMFIDRKIPGSMFGHEPDYTHHTSEDTPDKVDPVELERSEIISTATMLYLSNLTADQARELAYLTAAKSAQRLGEAGRQACRFVQSSLLSDLPLRAGEGNILIGETIRHEKSSVASVLSFYNDPGVRKLVEIFQRQLESQANLLSEEVMKIALQRGGVNLKPMVLERKDNRIPVRLTRGPLDFGLPESKLPEAERASRNYRLSGDVRFEIPNFIDGKRKMSDIERSLIAEFGRENVQAFDKFIEDLVTVGVVQWK